MRALEISFLIAELMGYFQSDPDLRKDREPRLIEQLETAAKSLAGKAHEKAALEKMSEVKIHPDAQRRRLLAVNLIPDEIIINVAMKMFAWLTACEDDKGKRPYQLIVEKGECPVPEAYYVARRFFLGKKVTASINDGKSIDLQLNVELIAVSNNAFPETDIEIEHSPASKEQYE